MDIRMGTDRAWEITIKDVDNNPIAYDPDNDVLSAVVWAGGSDQSVIFEPTVEWTDAPNGKVGLRINADDTTPTIGVTSMDQVAALVEPGRYKLLVFVTRTNPETQETRKEQVHADDLNLLEVPGTGTRLPSYVRYRDLLSYSQAIKKAEADSDETGFAYQQFLASQWFNDLIISRIPEGYSSFDHPGTSYGSSRATVKGYLDAGKLVVTPTVVEIVARRAVSQILGSLSDQKTMIAMSANMQARANALISSYVAEFDLNGDGYVDFSVPVNVLSSRYPTPTAW
ncbi:hypothetical protein TA3x_004274 [Tundrisphaera sp. TA3]|uniref:hypothetical protein n=1 Tax=Tundrisphaera sp. TA3 TaxID=3435775 RepID=UPI003EBD0F06